MTNEQLQAKLMIKRNRSFLTHQQMKTLNGLVKAGDTVGAMNGLHTIMARRNWNFNTTAR